jgi:hypothetical protein
MAIIEVMNRIAFLFLAISALGAIGCGTTTTLAYVPATNATSAIYDHAASGYAIPPQAPQGEIRVASYGIEQLTPGEAPDQHVGSLHVRLQVLNNSPKQWVLDTREQQLTIEGRATSTPAFASASPDPDSVPPVVAIAPHGSRLIDVFYPLPPDMQSAEKIPAFQFTSKVYTDQGPIAEVTPFQRVEVEGDTAYAYDDSVPPEDYNPYVYGYDYWDSPFYYNSAYIGFRGGVLFPREYWGGHVFARGWGWGRPGYYHPGYYYHGGRGGYRGGFHGGFHGGGHGGHR